MAAQVSESCLMIHVKQRSQTSCGKCSRRWLRLPGHESSQSSTSSMGSTEIIPGLSVSMDRTADPRPCKGASSAVDRAATQLPKSAAKPIRYPPPLGRSAAFSSTGPTRRQPAPARSSSQPTVVAGYLHRLATPSGTGPRSEVGHLTGPMGGTATALPSPEWNPMWPTGEGHVKLAQAQAFKAFE